ncbi:MAG: hypothetical protein WAL50_05975, partial [Kineosporiaceae bacterium]
LASAWMLAVREAGCAATPDRRAAQGELLLDRWAEPHRRYHDLRHLTAVLHGLDRLTHPESPPATVRLAAWFHDAVYRGRPGIDEEASAVLAEQVLAGLLAPARVPPEVARLVRVTGDHVVADGDVDGGLLVDADLAILAAPPERYLEYARAVRAEYAHLPDSAFVAGRLAALTSLAGRGTLFATARGAELWDRAARANLNAEIDRLSGGG